MPTKTRKRLLIGNRFSRRYDVATGSVITASNPRVFNWDDTFTGEDLRDYKRKIRAGENATTPASGWRGQYHYQRGETFVRYKDLITGKIYEQGSRGHLCDLGGIPSANVLDLSGADIEARLKFLSEYRDRRVAFQGGTFLGELPETLRMLRSRSLSLWELIVADQTALRRAVRRANRQLTRNMANAHLEVMYGWRPLMSDVNDLYRELYDLNRSYRKPIRGVGVIEATTNIGRNITAGVSGHDKWQYDVLRANEGIVRYLGAVDCRFHVPPSVSERLGFVPDNFVPTVYNLIPYSFLVDYFTNLGDLIDGMSIGDLRLAWGCRTEREIGKLYAANFTQDLSTFNSSLLQKLDNHATAPVAWCQGSRFVRSKITNLGVSIADFRFRVPGSGSTRWINLAALARLRLP